MRRVKLNKKLIYLDHAASTPLDPHVERAMRPFWRENFGNPSSIYKDGVGARKAIEDARERVAGILHCSAAEIIFTPGGTASDNLAVLGVARANKDHGNHVIVSAIEHEAVLEPAHELEREGFDVTFLKVDENGLVDPASVKKALRPETILVSIIYANNEVGTIQPIREIAKVVRDSRKANSYKLKAITYPYLHTDACQAANYLDLNVQKLGVDLMTLNGSKIYGPKMMGILYVKRRVRLAPIVYGGGQEHGVWSGTENAPGIMGFAKALEITRKIKERETKRLTMLREYFIKILPESVSGVTLNGHPEKRLPNNVHISIRGMEGEALVLYLDAKGVSASVGSACTSRSVEPSHVLRAMGMSKARARSSVRFTLGRGTSRRDCDDAVRAIGEVVRLLRI